MLSQINMYYSLQSDAFAEGERPDSPVAVGEKLSREATPTELEEGLSRETTQSPPIPATPDRGTLTDWLTDSQSLQHQIEVHPLTPNPCNTR